MSKLANVKILCLALALAMLSGVFFACHNAYAQADQPGYSEIKKKLKAGEEEDSDHMKCFNKNLTNWQGVGFLTFSKSSESSGRSGFFGPKIKVRYASWGWIPFTPNYYKIWQKTADLGSNQCTRLVGVRFCARYAGPAGTQLADGTTLKKDQHGYDPGRCTCKPQCNSSFRNPPGPNDLGGGTPCCNAEDYKDPNNTCCQNPHPVIVNPKTGQQLKDKDGNIVDCNNPATNKTQREDSCVSPLRFKTEHVTRLCAYEDAWDLSDMDEKFSPFHRMEDVCAKYTNKKARDACVANAAGNYAMMGALMGGVAGVFLAGFAAAIGALIAVFTGGALNYDVMTTSVGQSLGCVDVPLAPGPPVYYYTLQAAPPKPRVYVVSDDAADFQEDLLKYPPTMDLPLTDINHPENWRYEKNADWFYPKIGVMVGSNEVDVDSVTQTTLATQRDVRVLTGDFYAEDITMKSTVSPAKQPAGVGRIEPLPDLMHEDKDNDKRQVNNTKLVMDMTLDNGDVRKLTYDVATEVYNDEVCAYIVGQSFHQTVEIGGQPLPPPPSVTNPELIGCVPRPRSYYAMYDDPDGKFKKGDLFDLSDSDGQPYPQIFHPWYNQMGPGYPTGSLVPWDNGEPGQPGYVDYSAQPYASTYSEPKFFWWLVHDPRQSITPIGASGYNTYEKYKSDDTKASKEFRDRITDVVGKPIPQYGCDTPEQPTKNPVTDKAPLWTATWDSGVNDYFKRNVNRNHRLHGVAYCVENYDKNKNGVIDLEDSDLCAQYIGEGKTIEVQTKLPDGYDAKGNTVVTVAKAGVTPSRYRNVEFKGKIRIPVMPRATVAEKVLGEVITTFQSNPEKALDVDGDIHSVKGALDEAGNYKVGIRFYSSDPKVGCDKVLDPVTGKILDAASCHMESLAGVGTMYYRDPPDPLRGESVRDVNGKQMLVSLQYGANTDPADKTYPTHVKKGPYDLKEDQTITGQCPLTLLEDQLALLPQMPGNGCCAAKAADCPDPSTWVDPTQRSYTMPDILRGQTVRKSDQFEEGINHGYCVTVPPSGCPTLPVNNSDGSQVAKWLSTFANEKPGVFELKKGLGEGECMPGYGGARQVSPGVYDLEADGVYGEKPLRKCERGNTNFNSQGKWTDIVRPCLQLSCPAAESSYYDSAKNETVKCSWSKTNSTVWGQAICETVPPPPPPTDQSGGLVTYTINKYTRVKYCGENGQWKNYSCKLEESHTDGRETPGCTGIPDQ